MKTARQIKIHPKFLRLYAGFDTKYINLYTTFLTNSVIYDYKGMGVFGEKENRILNNYNSAKDIWGNGLYISLSKSMELSFNLDPPESTRIARATILNDSSINTEEKMKLDLNGFFDINDHIYKRIKCIKKYTKDVSVQENIEILETKLRFSNKVSLEDFTFINLASKQVIEDFLKEMINKIDVFVNSELDILKRKLMPIISQEHK